jgi:hypothetical protein
MGRVYLVVPGPRLSRSLVRELLTEGISEQDIRLIARQPNTLRDLPVLVTRFRPGPDILLRRAMAGVVLAMIGGLVVIAFTGGWHGYRRDVDLRHLGWCGGRCRDRNKQ